MSSPSNPATDTGARQRGLAPDLAIARELARVGLDLFMLPVHVAAYLIRRKALRAELAADLHATPELFEPASALHPPDRPLRVFVSCAEASGELHAVNLVDALRARFARAGAPEPELIGLGGRALAERGVRLVGSPGERASMGFSSALRSLPYYLGLVRACAERFREGDVDVFLPVDSPSLHVPLAHIARGYGVPTVHFVTPQHWGWAPWRVRGYARAVARACSILPFEPAWFARRGVRTAHVGHPILDAQASVPASRPPSASRRLALLPGSRRGVIQANLPWMLSVVRAERARLGELEVVVLQGDVETGALARELVAQAGMTELVQVREAGFHEELARARAAFAVSGTVLLDLLHHRLPTVVIYRTSWFHVAVGHRHLLTPPWFSSVNLLAAREVVPEFPVAGDGEPERVGAALVRCFQDDAWRAECLRGFDLAALRLGPPGACDRAAAVALEVACAAARAPRTAEVAA